MDVSLLLEYLWVLIVLVGMEGLLAADNALVLAIMVKPLPEKERNKALFYGLAGAFILRLGALFIISFLVNVWQVQAIGALYLLFICIHHMYKIFFKKEPHAAPAVHDKREKKEKAPSLWGTVLKVEIADLAFAVDSILAAVAMAIVLPPTTLPQIGGLDGGKFLVVFFGGFIGLIIMRFAASFFVKLLQSRPGLEVAAFLIVGWVGVKLLVTVLAHPALAVISEGFTHSPQWKLSFYIVLVGIALGGWFLSKKKELPSAQQD